MLLRWAPRLRPSPAARTGCFPECCLSPRIRWFNVSVESQLKRKQKSTVPTQPTKYKYGANATWMAVSPDFTLMRLRSDPSPLHPKNQTDLAAV